MLEYFRTVRIPVVLLVLLVLIVSVPQAVAASGSDNKPNIVLVLMDNFGYGEIGVYGGGVLRGAATHSRNSSIKRHLSMSGRCTLSARYVVGLVLLLNYPLGLLREEGNQIVYVIVC
jgi:hypothetical protein